MSGWFVSSNDIRNWTETNKRRSEEILPLLVKKLIYASCTPKAIDFGFGDSISIGGWDGILETDNGNEFVPMGKSGWELGTDNNVKKKADGDFDKRTTSSTPLVPADSTFVFVTTRLWSKRDRWIQAKQATKKWKSVKGINAETLSSWLETCPAVHRWFSEIIGKRSANIWDTDQAWKNFANQTALKLTTNFILYARENETQNLDRLMSSKANVQRIKANSKNEAYAFILAVIQNNEIGNSRGLVIKNQESWNLMSESKQPLILIPYGFIPSGLGAALTNGHTVILPVDDKETQSANIALNRRPRLLQEKAFKELGINEENSRILYQDTKGFFEPIIRHPILMPIDYVRPEWPQFIHPDVLFAALFASKWDERNKFDQQALETLSGMPYADFQNSVIALSKEDDPPIRQIGEIWQIISKMDFWLLVAPKIAKPQIQRLEKTVCLVLADQNPAYDLPENERHLAAIKGALPKYSLFIKKGISDSLALLSAHGDDFAKQIGGEKISSQVRYWIRLLFEKNFNARFWFSLGNCMMLIAESAPCDFLAAVEKATSKDSPILLDLFKAEGEAMFGGCYHANLLWSLELVAWNKQHLSRVSTCLARLAELDPGGKWSNRPFSSLVAIFLGWINNISASHNERLEIIEHVLIPNFPDITWRLMIKLLLKNAQSTSGVCKPEYREWDTNFDRNTSNKAYFGYVHSIVEFLFNEVEKDFEHRIIDLIENFASYDEQQQKKLISKMLSTNIEKISNNGREDILSKLRNTISRHRNYPEANWTLDSSLLDKLEEIYNHFCFKDYLQANIYLFNDYWPKIIDKQIAISEYDEKNKFIQNRRIATIERMFEERGTEGIKYVTSKCKMPKLVGFSGAKSSISALLHPIAIEGLAKEGWQRDFSHSFFSTFSNDYFEEAEKIFKTNNLWTQIEKAMYLLCLPLNKKTLNLVEDLEDKGKSVFWKNFDQFFFVNVDKTIFHCIASKLLENRKPFAAIQVISQLFHDDKDKSVIDCELVANILFSILSPHAETEKINLQTVRCEVLEGIEFLQDCGKIAEKVILQIEWSYLLIFRFEKISPRYLIKSVTEDGASFAQLVKWTYKRNDGKVDPDEEISEEQRNTRAELSYELLDTLSILPGQKGDDVDQEILEKWVSVCRKELIEVGRLEIGDDRLGVYLSKSPLGSDGIWPHESVRGIIENLQSSELDEALQVGRRNDRGVTTRDPYDGGEQERELAKKYFKDASFIQLISPRTAEILRSIAGSYEWDAEREDQRVELRD